MPLPIAPVGEALTVKKLLVDERDRRHLADLGIVTGAQVELISAAGGSVILRVKDGRLAIDRALALKILV